MIVQVNCPSDKTSVRYGQAEMKPDESHHLDVPNYVARQLVSLPGFSSSANLVASSASMLAASVAEDGECNYIFWGHSVTLPDLATRHDDAVALLADRGDPAVSAS